MIQTKLFWTALLGSLLMTAACSDDNEKTPEDLCADVVCAEGVCDPATGECAPCVGPSCTVDLCADVTCERGVCAADSGECVNAETCTTENEATTCLDGYGCYGQECVSAEEYCAAQTCERGVCSFEERGCVNGDSCSTDTQCLGGFFCDNGTCAENKCDADMVMCDRGVCNAADGTCINAENCTAGNECLDNNYCIEGACVDAGQACEVCTGNQECAYDGTNAVTCQESADGCDNSLDCLDDRVCDAGACVEPGTCQPDALEPNDATAPTVLSEGTPRQSATICGTDEDAFSYDTGADANFTGTLVGIVQFDAEDIGRGELAIELLNEAGDVVATGTTVNGFGRVSYTIGNLNRGIYRMVVKASGTISTAGVHYTAFMDLLDANTATACAAPVALQPTQDGNTLSGSSLDLAPSCSMADDAAEDIYAFELTEDTVVTLTLTSTSDADLVLSVRSTCEVDSSEFACLNEGTSSELYQQLLPAGRYFAVVQAANSTSSGTYTLNYNTAVPVCTQADNTCADVNIANVCNALGTGFDMVTCELGCDAASGRCARAEADVCYTAVDATNGYTGTIDWDTLSNDYEPDAACVPGTGTTGGSDAAFFVNLPPMSALTVNLVSNGYDDMSLYLARNCDAMAQTCFGGVDANYDEQLVYMNTKTVAEPLYVIADVEDFWYDTAEIEIKVEPVICTPGEAMCVGTVLETCNTAGTAYDQRTCGFGCDTQTTACVLPPNDVCGAGAIDISAGGTFTVDTTDYANDYALTSANCTGYSTNGNDAVYQLSGNPGDIVTLSLDGDFDTSLYVLSNCADFNSCLGGDDTVSTPEVVTFVLPSIDPVYVVVDGYGSSDIGIATLTVDIQVPDCTTPGQALTCLDATTLQYCNELGIITDYTCVGGCSNGACVTPTGDVCWDVIPILPGGTFTGDFDNVDNNLDPGASCIVSSDPLMDGPDTIFSVNLQAGETLVATLTTTSSSAGMYVLSSCDDTTCEYGVSPSKNLEFFSPTGGNYFLVVDSTSSYDGASFTLDVTTRTGDVCQPGGTSCDASGNVVLCNADGSQIDGFFACDIGCEAGYCVPPTTLNDTCASAMVISQNTLIRQSFGDLTDDYNPTSAGCTGTAMGGEDAVYAVSVPAGQTVLATVRSLDTFNSPAIYFVSDCSDVTTTCLSGETASDDEVTHGYYSATGETVYMVVDTEYDSTDGFIVEFEFVTAECTPGMDVCMDANTVAVCNDYHLYEEGSCYFGCTNGACDPAPNDQCSGAIDVTAGGNFVGEIDLYTADYNPGSTGCTGYNANGKDAAYVVNAAAGDVITLSLDADFDASLYVVTDCSDLTTCVDGSDSGNPEELTIVSTGVPLFIVVDAFSSTGSGQYDLSVSVETPSCTPGEKVCVDANTLAVCNASGIYENTACYFGCSVDACNPAPNDQCTGGIDISAGGTFIGEISEYTNDYNPGSSGCTGWSAAGKDSVYVLNVPAGQMVDLSLNAGFDASLYVVSDCSDMSTCVDGSDSGNPEEVAVYSDGNPLYVIVDAYSSSASGQYTLSVSFYTPLCEPNTYSCNDGLNIEVCDATGMATETYACDSTCTVGPTDACDTGSSCATAIPVAQSGLIQGTWLPWQKNYSGITGCGGSARGPENVYAVNLTTGQTLTATLTGTGSDTALYFIQDCNDITNTCLAGADTYGAETVTYTATADGVVYIVADNWSTTVTAVDYTLNVTIQ